MKTKKYLDFLFLLFLSVLIGVALYGHFLDGYILSINFYVGCILFLCTIFLVFFKRVYVYPLFYLLLIATLNLIVFTNYLSSAGSIKYIYHEDGIIIAGPGINPLMFLVLLVYCLINIKTLTNYFRTILKGSETEQEKKKSEMSEFYYNMFAKSSDDELQSSLNMFDEYPEEAKIALRKVTEERKSFIS